MASTSPPSTSSAMSTPAAVDSAALHSCSNCCRRMSSLKHDFHTICSQCRAVSCSVETRCSECKGWSVDAMQDHLKYQRSLARKSSNRKLAVTAASGSQPAVSSSPVGPSIPLAPAVSDSSQLKDAVLAVLQSLQGSLGINHDPSSTASSTVPSDVGALELPTQTSAISTSPVVHSDNISVLHANARSYVGMCSVTAADRSEPIGPSPSPLGSSDADQLQSHVVGPLSSSSSALSPTSLLFPLTPSPSLSSSLPPPPPGSPLSSYSSAVSSLLASVSSSSSSPIHSISPAFNPSSLALVSFPSYSFVSPSLPLPSSSLYTPPSSSSSSSGYHHPLSSSFSFLSSPLPSASSSVSSHPPVPPPPGFPASSFYSQAPPSSSSSSPLPPPPILSYASASSFRSVPLPSLGGISTSSSIPLSSSSSSSFGAVSSLADHQARLLGLSSEYQSLARWFMSSGGSDFAALVRSSFPHVLPDLSRDFTSGSSLPHHLALGTYHSFPSYFLHSAIWCSPLVFPLPWCPRATSFYLAVSRFSSACSSFHYHSSSSWLSPACFFHLFGVGFFSFGTRVGCGCPASCWGSPLPD